MVFSVLHGVVSPIVEEDQSLVPRILEQSRATFSWVLGRFSMVSFKRMRCSRIYETG